jgi:hypothetical protein
VTVRVATAADGSYRALLPAPGRYVASVEASRGPAQRRLDVAASGRYDVELDDASIRGRVVGSDGVGFEHANVVLRRNGGSTVATTYSGSDGSFGFSGLSEGGYRLAAHHEAGIAESTLTLAAGATEEVDLEIEERPALRLRLVDSETGAAVVRGALRLYDARLALVVERRFSDAGGEIRVPVTDGGPYVAVVSAYGFGLATLFDLSPAEGPRAVALRRPATLVVRPGLGTGAVALLDAQGRAVALSFERPPGPVAVSGETVIFPGLATGRHLLAGGGGQHPVELTAGRQTLIEL